MTVARLCKQAPTLILVASLGYALSAIESEVPDSADRKAEMEKGLDRMMQDVIAEGTTAAVKLEGTLRDPFWIPAATPPQKVAEDEEDAAPPARDELAEVVRGMTLEATFIQGRDQFAVIDGRIYGRGQGIAIPGGDPASGRTLRLLAVTRTGILLSGGDKHYSLGYPDRLGMPRKEDRAPESSAERAISEIDPAGQMEMFQRLLNSPLGAMGRGLIGDAGALGAPSGPAAKARGRRGPDSRARGSGSGPP